MITLFNIDLFYSKVEFSAIVWNLKAKSVGFSEIIEDNVTNLDTYIKSVKQVQDDLWVP